MEIVAGVGVIALVLLIVRRIGLHEPLPEAAGRRGASGSAEAVVLAGSARCGRAGDARRGGDGGGGSD